MNLAMCEVPVHPVQFLSVAELEALTELPMTQAEDGTWYCDGESTQYTQEQGKNLFDKDNASYVSDIACGGYDFVSGVSGVRIYYINASPNKTYTFSKSLGTFNRVVTCSNIPEIGATITKNNSDTGINTCTITTGKNDYYIAFYPLLVAEIDTIGYDAVIETIMIEEGSEATDYEPFQPQMPNPDYPSPILNTYPAGTYKAICGDNTYKVVLDDDLRSVPGVADRVRIDEGRCVCWVERKVAVTELDGSTDELWGIRTDTDNAYYSQIIKVSNNATPSLCDKFLKTTTISALKDGYYYTGTSSASFRNDDTQTIGEWKEWLSQNPVTVQYCLITPTTHQSVPTLLITISAGRSVTIPNTVNDAVDMLAVKGDSWQLVQEEITDKDGNVTQPAMPSPEYPSEIVSVEGWMGSCGWNIADITGFSATSDNANKLTNAYGTEISTTEPTNKLVVTQTPNNNYRVESFQNGYIIVKLKNKMIKNKKYILSLDIDIIANPFNVKTVAFTPNGVSIQYIKLQENGKCRGIVIWDEYLERNYLEMRCMGMSFTISNIQITEETQEHPYDRRRGNTITLPTLRSLPDGTRDVLHVDRAAKRAWVERCVGVVEFDGSEDEGWNTINTGYYIVILDAIKKNHAPVCNRYEGYAYSSPPYKDNKVCMNFNRAFVITDSNRLSGVSIKDLKTWLSQNPLTVHYQLAEPTIEELEYSYYLLQTAQYGTNLTVDCDEHLEPEISATVKILGR